MEENLKNMYDGYSKRLAKLEEENQRLKQTIKTMRQNVRNGSLEDAKYIDGLKEEIEDWREENQQLKQQIQELNTILKKYEVNKNE